jgi:TIR domain/Predicted nucleotide-binding protein containing TIR-like domain
MKPTVFVSSSTESRPLVKYLKEDLSSDATVITWADAPFSLAQPPLAQFSQSLSGADFVVFLVDLAAAARTRGATEVQPRDNIIFELGLFIGRLGPGRVLVVDITRDDDSFRLPTDLSGLTILRARGRRGLDNPRQLSKYVADEVRRRTQYVEPKPSTEQSTYSCFISYSHPDQSFASRIFEDLSAIGARCWLDRHELRAGDSISDRVRAALLATDKFLAIVSKASVRSPWFQLELRQALELEAKRSTTVLIPIRIDDAVFAADGQLWVDMRDRLIADFRDWQSENGYNKAFRQLALNLSTSVSEDRASRDS